MPAEGVIAVVNQEDKYLMRLADDSTRSVNCGIEAGENGNYLIMKEMRSSIALLEIQLQEELV